MLEKIREPVAPHGLARLAFRAPLALYRLGLGRLLGRRFLRLTHTGRVSGQPRQTVLEVVRCDPDTHACVVASGWGEKADWVRNITANPHVRVEVGAQRYAALARRLTPDNAAREMADYAHRHPILMRELARVMGYRIDGSPDSARALGRQVPMFIFEPLESSSSPNPGSDR